MVNRIGEKSAAGQGCMGTRQEGRERGGVNRWVVGVVGEWVDGWTHGQMDGWTNGQVDGWMSEWVGGWTYG